MTFVVAGVAVVLLVALAIGWSRRRSTPPSPDRPFFEPDGEAAERPRPRSGGATTVSDADGREPVTADNAAPVGAATAASADRLLSSSSLTSRSAPGSSQTSATERPGTVRFWQLFDEDADLDAGPVCFAVDGVTVDGVVDLVTMDFEHRGFVVRSLAPDTIQAHQGPVVLQATFRSLHTDLTRDRSTYRGTAQPFVVVEIEVPPKDPPRPMPPTVGVS